MHYLQRPAAYLQGNDNSMLPKSVKELQELPDLVRCHICMRHRPSVSPYGWVSKHGNHLTFEHSSQKR